MILDDHSAPTAPSSATITATGLPPSVDALGKKLLKIAPDRASPQAVAHMQKFVVFLQESLQDRSLAISHQRKTNQILGKKVCLGVDLMPSFDEGFGLVFYLVMKER